MNRLLLMVVILLISPLGDLSKSLQAASPALRYIAPRGAQQGTEVKVTFSGRWLNDAQEVYFYQPGITLLKFEKAKSSKVCIAYLKIAKNCKVGEHTLAIRTKSGVSDFRSFWVGRFAEVAEKEPNTEFVKPQEISKNITVTGVIQREDVDYFVIDAKKGERISAEVEGIRLGELLFDPYLAILDSKRFELATSDDFSLLRQDAALSIIAPADGKYIIELRESAYGGNGRCKYRLHVGTFPRPSGIYPAGGKVGSEVTVSFVGDASGVISQKVKLPVKRDNHYSIFAKDKGGIAPSANPFRVSLYDNVLEAEPNNDQSNATKGNISEAYNGIIQAEGDVDYFKFTTKKGAVLDFECYARRLRSPLDPVMALYNKQGKRVAYNDDSRGPDSYFQYKIPADGEYFLMVKDHLDRGGKDFVYRVEVHSPEPSLSLLIPRNSRYGQERQTIVVPRGNRFATVMEVTRQNVKGEINLTATNLPPGVSIQTETMPAGMTTMPVLFEAKKEAPMGGKLFAENHFKAKLKNKKTELQAGFHHRTMYVRGGNGGGQSFIDGVVHQIPITVVEESPFTIEIVQPKAPLVQNGTMTLKVVVHRKKGFDAPVQVLFPFRSPGVSATSSIKIPKGKSEGYYPINANGNARVGKWKVFAIGGAENKGVVWVSSQLATLEVTKPFITVALSRTACEQGKEAEIICKIKQLVPFKGTATIKLIGFPNKVTTTDIKVTKDQKEAVFKVKTDAKSPVGRHKSIYCQILVPVNGGESIHRAGRVELRIDKPRPPKKKKVTTQKTKPSKVVKKNVVIKPTIKRLTRLEKLRLEAKKKASGQ
ncbi:hypothetical protein MNBD_PLANCTO02-706 [hydrothermal vent metagenome]|uniref:Peptidase C-terminal archaeal/bacterial domain-containing protein n=1 Tax=hydrothermal vent metagenome TaxID=652676 RepID=A0A3B1D8D7_9ZZZZ